MHQLEIDASPSQIRKLIKGHKVRVKRGKGLCLTVHPNTYNIASRSFNKGKGTQLQLTQEEIRANYAPAPDQDVQEDDYDMETSGAGIFDDMRNLGRKVQSGISKAQDFGRKVKSGYDKAEGYARTAERAYDKYKNYTPNQGLNEAFSHLKLSDRLNKELGSNYGYLQRAGLDNAIQGAKSAALSRMGIDARMMDAPMHKIMSGNGLHEPHSRMVGGQLERASIGRNGGMISMYTPPALVSQPFSANFQFQHFLPPQYQHFNSGGGATGTGLYL